MKLFLILSLLIVNTAYSQNLFKVISVNGEILAKKINKKLATGTEVGNDEQFVFIMPNSRAALINPKYGRIILTEQNANDAFSKAAFAPAISTTVTRASKSLFEEEEITYTLNNNSILVNFYSKNQISSFFNKPLVIIDQLKLIINPNLYPMNEKSYFFIRYLYKGEEINKKLSFTGDTLIINKKDLYTVDGKPIPNPDINEMKLYYYTTSEEKPRAILIATFNLYFLNSDTLKEEVKIIVESLKDESNSFIINEIYNYINSFYNPIDYEYLLYWLHKEFGLKE